MFQAILQNSSVAVEIEVRPKHLVPDTNCFIDYLPQLQNITKASSNNAQHMYTLMVPLVGEFEYYIIEKFWYINQEGSILPPQWSMIEFCNVDEI